jgi:hypothetical protein
LQRVAHLRFPHRRNGNMCGVQNNQQCPERKIRMRKLLTMLVAAIFAAASLNVAAAESSGGDAPQASAKKSDKAKKPAKSKKSRKSAKK